MGECKGLKAIYRQEGGARKRARGEDKESDQGKDKPNDQEEDPEDQDRDPHHAYKTPACTALTIFGGKAVPETGWQRKLRYRAVLIVSKSDGTIFDPKY